MGTSREFRVTIGLRVEDAGALWDAAAAQAMTILGMTLDDVAETIGDRAAAQVSDCLTLLADPMRFAGCTPTAFAVEVEPVAAAPIATAPLRPRTPALGRRRTSRAADPVKRVDRAVCIAPL